MSVSIFFDEAGNTGGDLANPEQPAFVLSSHQIPEAEARERLAHHFATTQAKELKYSNVRRRESHRARMVDLVKALRFDARPFALYPVHKRFALFQRLFDYLAEPVMHETGINVYDGALNIQLTNEGYLVLEKALGEPFMTRLLGLFQQAVNERSHEVLAEMWRHLEGGRARRPSRHRKVIDLLLIGKLPGAKYFDQLPAHPLDIAFGIFIALVAHWRRLSPGPFEIVHDESKPMARNRAIWEWLSSPEQQEAALGFGDYRDMYLPLNVVRTELANSKDHAGLQLADLLAGGCLEVCRLGLGDTSNEAYAKTLLEAGLDDVVNNIWPQAAWIPPKSGGRTDAKDPLDFIGKQATEILDRRK